MDLPFVTPDQMREVDRAMMEDYSILLVQMMENAGGLVARLARYRFLNGDPRGRRVLVLAGTGGNGGGGLVAARRLSIWGADVSVYLADHPDRFAEVPRHQLSILERMEIPVAMGPPGASLPSSDLIIDAIIGYSLTGAPRGTAADLIRAAQQGGSSILSLDVPSGLDPASGVVHDPTIRATATLTLALPKEGLRSPVAREYVGELYLGDISVPSQLYQSPPLNICAGSIFAQDDIIQLW
jgi:NAD(P)H-hydrate epimerase